MIHSLLALLSQHWLVLVSFCVLAYLAKNRFHNGLQKYPGPLFASLTDWWRFFDVLGRRPDITHVELHGKYGDIVRLGPNTLSFANPAAIKIIYGLNKGFTKVLLINRSAIISSTYSKPVGVLPCTTSYL